MSEPPNPFRHVTEYDPDARRSYRARMIEFRQRLGKRTKETARRLIKHWPRGFRWRL